MPRHFPPTLKGENMMPDKITQIPHNPPTKEELEAFIETHSDYMTNLLKAWLLGTRSLLRDCDPQTQFKTMKLIVDSIKERFNP